MGLKSANQAIIGSWSPFGGGEREEIIAAVTKMAYWKLAGVKSCHSTTICIGYGTTFTFFILHLIQNCTSNAKQPLLYLLNSFFSQKVRKGRVDQYNPRPRPRRQLQSKSRSIVSSFGNRLQRCTSPNNETNKQVISYAASIVIVISVNFDL